MCTVVCLVSVLQFFPFYAPLTSVPSNLSNMCAPGKPLSLPYRANPSHSCCLQYELDNIKTSVVCYLMDYFNICHHLFSAGEKMAFTWPNPAERALLLRKRMEGWWDGVWGGFQENRQRCHFTAKIITANV